MKKVNNFHGWKTVFDFTFHQASKGGAFRIVTALVSVVILGIFIVANLLVAKPDEEKVIEPSTITQVYIQDSSGLTEMDFRLYEEALNGPAFAEISFEYQVVATKEELVAKAKQNSDTTLALAIYTDEDAFVLEALIQSESQISKSEADELLQVISTAYQTGKLLQSGLSPEILSMVLTPVVTSYGEIGEEENVAAMVIQMIAPMLFGLMLYFMLLLYGQNISKSVSTEKTSKLVESLLTSVHPYALITGKVLAITSMAIMQFLIWVISIVAGLYGGNYVAKQVYPGYESSVIEIINFLKENIGESALSLPAVILAVLFFCVGFLFYCVLAGLAGCMVTKPEEASSTQTLFQMPVIISWLVCYLASAAGNLEIIRVARFIPFTAPFCIPVDLITGAASLTTGLISLAILCIFTLLTIMLSARIFKGLVLYTGEKVNLKMLANVLKNKG